MATRGYYGIGMAYPTKEINLGTLFRSAFCYRASFIFTIGARYRRQSSDTVASYRHIPYFSYKTLQDFFKAKPYDCQLIGVELTAKARDIKNFIHPERALYILGPENGSLDSSILNKCQHTIKINTRQCLNVASCGTVIMHDRQMKNKEQK